MNGQNLTKFCIFIITDKSYVGIVMQHQFFKIKLCHCISLSSGSAMVGLKSDPLTILVCFVDFWSGGVEFCSGVGSNFV